MSFNEKSASALASYNREVVEETARKANHRGKFLSAMNKQCSGPFGEKLIHAFATGNENEFASLWDELSDNIMQRVKENAGGDETAAVVETVEAPVVESASTMTMAKLRRATELATKPPVLTRTNYEIRDIYGKGRGLVATAHIKAGDLITESSMLVFPVGDPATTRESLLSNYNWHWGFDSAGNVDEDSQNVAFLVGDGNLANHSMEANAEYTLNGVDRTHVIRAARDIAPGEEISLNYGWFEDQASYDAFFAAEAEEAAYIEETAVKGKFSRYGDYNRGTPETRQWQKEALERQAKGGGNKKRKASKFGKYVPSQRELDEDEGRDAENESMGPRVKMKGLGRKRMAEKRAAEAEKPGDGLRNLMARYAELKAKGTPSDNKELQDLGEQIGKIKNALRKKGGETASVVEIAKGKKGPQRFLKGKGGVMRERPSVEDTIYKPKSFKGKGPKSPVALYWPIQQILAYEPVGSASGDDKAMRAIHNFIVDSSNPMKDRQKALQKLDKIMGEDTGELPSAADVKAYIDEMGGETASFEEIAKGKGKQRVFKGKGGVMFTKGKGKATGIAGHGAYKALEAALIKAGWKPKRDSIDKQVWMKQRQLLTLTLTTERRGNSVIEYEYDGGGGSIWENEEDIQGHIEDIEGNLDLASFEDTAALAAVTIKGVRLTPSEQMALRYAFVNEPTGNMIYSPTAGSKVMRQNLTDKGLLVITPQKQLGLTPLAIEIKKELEARKAQASGRGDILIMIVEPDVFVVDWVGPGDNDFEVLDQAKIPEGQAAKDFAADTFLQKYDLALEDIMFA